MRSIENGENYDLYRTAFYILARDLYTGLINKIINLILAVFKGWRERGVKLDEITIEAH